MSSQQPTLGGAIGEAGLTGISALRTARGERDERTERAQARADRLAAAAATRDKPPAYQYREVSDMTGLADTYAEEAQRIAEARGGVPPTEGDPDYDDYINNIAMANVLRNRARAVMMASLGMQ
jgi:hypothetical protein